ncbi:arsenate reductase (glutaredoxin) [Methylococcus sp. EFPC2]|uniref:arsenate reductase (glutaredoxin) n=1 Tax=Methylococcus sp. EFPC2 TaxID=2812648 RepID=UPI001967474C|nr:arsenate reductase (glutaredoxin) [Methylococcus sp. EFPC2]QSA97440.1 arsenate reductase (glutaredoxin) [Methylococcus sp. EFPC2]
MSLTIYHNPRCSKSRAALELVRGKNSAAEVVEYLKVPPTAEELENLLNLLGMEPRELMRKGEAIYKEAGLDDPSLDRKALIAAMVQHPILIERPIVVHDGKAVIGRPPEKVLEIL